MNVPNIKIHKKQGEYFNFSISSNYKITHSDIEKLGSLTNGYVLYRTKSEDVVDKVKKHFKELYLNEAAKAYWRLCI